MERMECPICGRLFAKSVISAHADRCLDETDIDDAEFISDVSFSSDSKRQRLDSYEEDVDAQSKFSCPPRSGSPALCDLSAPFVKTEGTSASAVSLTDCRPTGSCQSSAQNLQSADVCSTPHQSLTLNMQPVSANTSASPGRSTHSTGLWGIFTSPRKSVQLKGSKASKGCVKPAVAVPSTLQSDVQLANLANENRRTMSSGDMPHMVRSTASAVKESKSADTPVPYSSTAKPSSQPSSVSSSVPLAERMRPTMLADFVGQGHVVGSQRPLRSLLESTTVSSMILWGPPGCGKVTVSSLMCLP